MVDNQYVEIVNVRADSIAAELGIEVGDQLVEIDGQQIRDYIDYKFLCTDLYLEVLIKKSSGEEWLLEIEKEYDEDLGLEFSGIIYDKLKKCSNNCIFCFVNQAPEGLRKTLNLKDDDYRFSFLQGSYITLTNLSQDELERIKRLHLSPLYVSVHTTNPQLRAKMMRNSTAGEILSILKELAEAGIQFHTQIVLCPEFNDGAELDRTISDLIELSAAIKSLAVVPVGLTKYRNNLYPLRSFRANEAEEVIEQVTTWQEKLRNREESNFIYLSDEFYLLADREIPPAEEYNGFPQLENGVGMVRRLWQQFAQLEDELPTALSKSREYTLVTGELGKKALAPLIDRLNQITGLKIELLEVQNQFFGSEVTVTGLLAGADIIRALRNKVVANQVVLPAVLLNDDQLLIDDLHIDDLRAEFPELDFIIVENEAADLVEQLVKIQPGGGVNE
ncbi:MAG: DUF512 domain-containing protein [Bacillota bacterium]